MTIKSEVFISVDFESSGPIPGHYSMLSLGRASLGAMTKVSMPNLSR